MYHSIYIEYIMTNKSAVQLKSEYFENTDETGP